MGRKQGEGSYGSIPDCISNIAFLYYTDHYHLIDTGTFQYKKRKSICEREIPGNFFGCVFEHIF